jgi:glycosyltransferase involved in cell wall biosynthesis
VLPYGIDDLSAGVERRPLKPPVILYVGLLSESKGLLVLLDACVLLAARGWDFRLQLVGAPVSEAFAALLKSRATATKLGDKVLWSGVLTGAAKAEAYAGATVFCFPTYFEAESFGVVLLEAMAFSLPVVATSWRGIPSIVEDDKTGLLVPVRDSDALARSLDAVLANPDLAGRLGRSGRRRFEECFTLDAYWEGVQQTFELLRQPTHSGRREFDDS